MIQGLQVYLNAIGLLLRVYIRGGDAVFEDRLKVLADCLADQVSGYPSLSIVVWIWIQRFVF